MYMFNQFENATTSIKVANLPQVAGKLKSTMLAYQYATACEWYDALKNATMVKEIFDIFGIKFVADKANGTFIPVIENINPHPQFKEALKAVAPYMENGSIYASDSNRYYTITFTDGNISGKVRKVDDNKAITAPTTPPVTKTTTPPQKAPKKSYRTSKKGKANTISKGKKFEFTKTIEAPVTLKRADNTYTVQELVKELLRQMDAGNGNKKVTIDADFLFQNEKYA